MPKSFVGKVRAKLQELYTREIKVDKQNKNIYLNGDDNLYPYEIERAINNSPTATRAADIMQKFITGKGVENDVLVNKKKGYYLSDIANLAGTDISIQNGFFIWVGYGLDLAGEEFVPVSNKLDVLDYSNTRISKEDDNEYNGRIYYKDYQCKKVNYGKDRSETKDEWFYPYNSSADIIISQMKADARKALGRKKDELVTIEEMVKHYRGQVLYVNLTPRYKYALSKFDSVFNDADSEYRFSLYVNTQMRSGFLGKTAVVMQGLDEEDEEQEFENVTKWLGAENSGGVYCLNVEQIEDLDNVLKIVQPKAQLDDKLFVENDKRIRRNILGAANNLPEPLIYAGEGALFGTSGDTYKQMKLFYQEQTQRERSAIEKTLKRLGFETKIIPIIEEDADTEV
ncbi:MAG TPA: hypothetical protein VFM82_03480 [Flavobacteriaceae bacterium]|nr:hypothetical protein [Flavobacteriaceae bacterium]